MMDQECALLMSFVSLSRVLDSLALSGRPAHTCLDLLMDRQKEHLDVEDGYGALD